MRLYRAMKWWSYKYDGDYFNPYGSNYQLFKDGSVVHHKGIGNGACTVYFSSTEKALECYNWLKKEGLI